MAKIKDLVSFICVWEGGYVNDPSDSGGPTNKGVTLKTWQQVGYDKNGDGLIDESDLVRVTHEDMVEVVLKPHYWDSWQADRIENQSIANLVVDWMWLSGHRTIFLVQEVLGVKQDGIVGEKTLHALNDYPDQQLLFEIIKTKRIQDIHSLCVKYPKNIRFKRGWLNRIAAIKFLPIILLFCFMGNFTACRSLRRYDVQTASDTTTSKQEMATDKQQASTTLSDLELSTINTDSITETIVVRFKQAHIEGQDRKIIPVDMYGMAVVTRHKITQTKMVNAHKQAEAILQSDTTTIQSVAMESKQVQQQSKQPEVWSKPLLAGFLIVLLALWLYYVFHWKR